MPAETPYLAQAAVQLTGNPKQAEEIVQAACPELVEGGWMWESGGRDSMYNGQ